MILSERWISAGCLSKHLWALELWEILFGWRCPSSSSTSQSWKFLILQAQSFLSRGRRRRQRWDRRGKQSKIGTPHPSVSAICWTDTDRFWWHRILSVQLRYRVIVPTAASASEFSPSFNLKQYILTHIKLKLILELNKNHHDSHFASCSSFEQLNHDEWVNWLLEK